MRVVVTGAAGYFGGVVCGHLLARGHHVVAVDALRRAEGALGVAPWLSHPLFTPELVAIESPRFETAMAAPDVIVHLAAVVGAEACQDAPVLAHQTNVVMLRRVLALARDAGAHVIFASTCSNYGAQSAPCDESADLMPLSLYASTKIEGEGLVRASGVSATVLRFATLCGAGAVVQRPELMVADWTRAMLQRRKIEVYSPDAYRPHLHIRDGARAIAHAVEQGVTGTYNVASENLTKAELVQLIATTLGRRQDFVVQAAHKDIRDYRVTTKAFRATGWAPEHTVEQAIREVALL